VFSKGYPVRKVQW